ncbi:MAG: molecular chaperone DnaJ [Bdellovibrionales bacterium]
MDNVIEFNEFAYASSCQTGEACCWICQKPTSLRALFCQHCGTIQPVRPLDHFARLGLERRIDIDPDLLERQYATLKKNLSPERFTIRGMGERGHAAKQLEAIEEAYQTLREPLRRGRYWLALHEKEIQEAEIVNPMVAELRADLENASAAAQCDRIAHRAGLAMEQGIVGLMQALRTQNWQLANAILLEVDGLEGLMSEVRSRRLTMTAPRGTGCDDITRVK